MKNHFKSNSIISERLQVVFNYIVLKFENDNKIEFNAYTFRSLKLSFFRG